MTRRSTLIFFVLLGALTSLARATTDDCSSGVEDRLRNIAMGAYTSGDWNRMKEAETTVSRIKEAQQIQTDCEVLAQIDLLDPPNTRHVECESGRAVVESRGAPLVWEKVDLDFAVSSLLMIDGSTDLVKQCNDRYPADSVCRNDAVAQYKERVNYAALAALIKDHQSKSEAEGLSQMRDAYNPTLNAMRAKAMTEAECNETANQLRTQAALSQEDWERAQAHKRQ